jgi:hypothetical protein
LIIKFTANSTFTHKSFGQLANVIYESGEVDLKFYIPGEVRQNSHKMAQESVDVHYICRRSVRNIKGARECFRELNAQ